MSGRSRSRGPFTWWLRQEDLQDRLDTDVATACAQIPASTAVLTVRVCSGCLCQCFVAQPVIRWLQWGSAKHTAAPVLIPTCRTPLSTTQVHGTADADVPVADACEFDKLIQVK